MKIAAVQMVSAPDWPSNRATAARLIAQAAAAGAALVALPEYFCLMGQRDSDKLALAEPSGSGPIQQFLSDTARRHGLWLVGGTLPVHSGAPGRVLNRCCVFAPDGSQAGHYDKLHLFAYDNGREAYDEGPHAAGRYCPGGGAGGGTASRAEHLLRPALSGAVPRADESAL
jgi:predicted amidohydrolase